MGPTDGNLTLGISNTGNWGAIYHVHDSGAVSANYRVGILNSAAVPGGAFGSYHSGSVSGTLAFGSRNSDFAPNGKDDRLVNSWDAIAAGNWSCKMNTQTTVWTAVQDTLGATFGVPGITATLAFVSGSNNNYAGTCNFGAQGAYGCAP